MKHFTRLDAQAVIGHRTGDRKTALHQIHAIHGFAGLRYLALLGELLGGFDGGRVLTHKIVVERNDNVGAVEVIRGLETLAEDHLRSHDGVAAIERVILRPFRFGVLLQQLGFERQQGRRRGAFGQDPESSACAKRSHFLSGKLVPRRPTGGDTALMDAAGTVGIVDTQNGGLGQRRGRTLTIRVHRIAFHFRGASIMHFHLNTIGNAAIDEGRRVVHRLAGDDVFGGLRDGENLLFGATAGHQPGHAERSGHQLEHGATRIGIENLGSAGEFVLHPLVEPGCAGELIEAAPILLAWLVGRVGRF